MSGKTHFMLEEEHLSEEEFQRIERWRAEGAFMGPAVAAASLVVPRRPGMKAFLQGPLRIYARSAQEPQELLFMVLPPGQEVLLESVDVTGPPNDPNMEWDELMTMPVSIWKLMAIRPFGFFNQAEVTEAPCIEPELPLFERTRRKTQALWGQST